MVQLKGISIPVVTPFNKNNELNEDGFRTIIAYLIENGVHGIIPCGSTGETVNLRMAERKKTAEITVDEVNGRVPVIVGTGDSATDRAIELTKHAVDIGADAALVVTPFYFTPSQEALYEYFSEIASAVDIPVILYMVPKFTGGVEIDPKTVIRLQKHSNIIGIKMSITDVRKISAMINVATNENFKVYAGSGSAIFTTLMLGEGAAGAVPATGNVAPKLCSEIYDFFIEGNIEKARDLQLKVLPLDDFLTGPTGYGVPATKAGMELLGLPAGMPRKPLLPITDGIKHELKSLLEGLDLLKSD